MLKALQIGAISKSSSNIAPADSTHNSTAHQEEAVSSHTSRMEPMVDPQFSMFTDYFGLCNIVSSMRDQYSISNNSNSRERRDSLGSAASSSDFSMSTGGSAPDSSDGSSEFYGGMMNGGIGSYPTTPN